MHGIIVRVPIFLIVKSMPAVKYEQISIREDVTWEESTGNQANQKKIALEE